MTDVSATLTARGAGYAVIQKCMSMQAAARPRGRIATFFGSSPLHPDARSWYSGALGEIAVAAQLAKLGEGWTVLHAVPVGLGDTDIDHVVIGPAGVFTINTKRHLDKKIWVGGNMLTVDGHKTEYVRKSVSEARRAADLLRQGLGGPVPVTPLIVVVGSSSISIGKKKSPAVQVLPIERIPRWLQVRDRTLSDPAIQRIAAVASDRSTWQPTSVSDDGLRHVHRFQRLQKEVDAARVRRRWWALSTGALMAGSLSIVAVVGLPSLVMGALAAVP